MKAGRPGLFFGTILSSLGLLLSSQLAGGAFADSPSESGNRPIIRLIQAGRADLRSKNGIPSEVIERAELEVSFKKPWRLLPFVEFRRDVDRSSWSRMELGAEVGVKPFEGWCRGSCSWWTAPFRWFYVGNGIHQAWVVPGRDRPEWEIRSVFDIPLPWEWRSRPLGLYALNEYTYDLRRGTAIRNEVGAGLKLPLPMWRASALLGWRHVDLIHRTDEDQFEGSIQMEF